MKKILFILSLLLLQVTLFANNKPIVDPEGGRSIDQVVSTKNVRKNNVISSSDTTIVVRVCKDSSITYHCPEGGDTVYVASDSSLKFQPTFILAGQSNAQGYNYTTVSVPDSLNGPLAGCYIFSYANDSIETLQYGVNNLGYSATPAKHGIELAFMKKRFLLTGDTALMIKFASSGTYIWKSPTVQDWNTGSNHELYWKLRTYINAGLGWQKESGYQPKDITLIWWQGEQDSDSLNHANAYYQNTLNLFIRLRADMPALANMKVLIIQIRNITQTNSNYDTNVMASEQQLADDYDWIDIIVNDSGAANNQVHHTSAQYNYLGIKAALKLPY